MENTPKNTAQVMLDFFKSVGESDLPALTKEQKSEMISSMKTLMNRKERRKLASDIRRGKI